MSRRVAPAYAGMKPEHIVEAALFSAGRAVSVDEIMEETGLGRKKVSDAIQALQATYKQQDTVLEVSKAGAKWAMQVKSRAAEPAARFAAMEIPKKTLKTLALIAYHQPMKQSELVDMIGSKAYDHVGELRERGLVRARKDGITKVLSTTPEFPEYFGLDAANTDQVRVAMAKLVGLPPPAKREKQKEKHLAAFEAVVDAVQDTDADPDADPDAARDAAADARTAADAGAQADATGASQGDKRPGDGSRASRQGAETKMASGAEEAPEGAEVTATQENG